MGEHRRFPALPEDSDVEGGGVQPYRGKWGPGASTAPGEHVPPSPAPQTCGYPPNSSVRGPHPVRLWGAPALSWWGQGWDIWGLMEVGAELWPSKFLAGPAECSGRSSAGICSLRGGAGASPASTKQRDTTGKGDQGCGKGGPGLREGGQSCGPGLQLRSSALMVTVPQDPVSPHGLDPRRGRGLTMGGCDGLGSWVCLL